MNFWKRLAVGASLSVLATACGGTSENETVAEVTTSTSPTTSAPQEDSSTTTAAPQQTTTAPPTSVATTQAPEAAGGADSPEAVLRQFMEVRSLGQTGRAWELLLPAQRALMNRDSYLGCVDSIPLNDIKVEVIDEYEERLTVPGIGEQDTKALTLRLTATIAGEEMTDVDTFHAAREGDRWYAFLDQETFSCAQV